MTDGDRLTLRQALDEDRLPEFVVQQEAAGLPPADRKAFEAVVGDAVKPAPAAHQTSDFQAPGGSSGSRTRRGKAAVDEARIAALEIDVSALVETRTACGTEDRILDLRTLPKGVVKLIFRSSY